jgi:hypothetical protein
MTAEEFMNDADRFLAERKITFAKETDRIAACSLMQEFAEAREKELREALRNLSHYPDSNIGADWKPVFKRVRELLAGEPEK